MLKYPQSICQLNASLLASDKSRNMIDKIKLLALCAPDTNSIRFCSITITAKATPNTQDDRKLSIPYPKCNTPDLSAVNFSKN